MNNTATYARDISPVPDDGSEASHAHVPDFEQTQLCKICAVSFDTSTERRRHVEQPWHAYNLRRREVSLPPIPEDAFNQRIGFLREIVDERWGSLQDAETAPLSRQRNPQDSTPPTRCLFCPQAFSAQDNPTEALLNHMLAEHGFTIPHEEAVTHLPSLLRYLSSLVYTWHECVFCGVAFDSATAVQTHMRDAGHCALDLERASGVVEFWGHGVFSELAGSDEKGDGRRTLPG